MHSMIFLVSCKTSASELQYKRGGVVQKPDQLATGSTLSACFSGNAVRIFLHQKGSTAHLQMIERDTIVNFEHKFLNKQGLQSGCVYLIHVEALPV